MPGRNLNRMQPMPLISSFTIDALMSQSLMGARADDPVVPDRAPRRARRAWLTRSSRRSSRRPAVTARAACVAPPSSS